MLIMSIVLINIVNFGVKLPKGDSFHSDIGVVYIFKPSATERVYIFASCLVLRLRDTQSG